MLEGRPAADDSGNGWTSLALARLALRWIVYIGRVHAAIADDGAIRPATLRWRRQQVEQRHHWTATTTSCKTRQEEEADSHCRCQCQCTRNRRDIVIVCLRVAASSVSASVSVFVVLFLFLFPWMSLYPFRGAHTRREARTSVERTSARGLRLSMKMETRH